MKYYKIIYGMHEITITGDEVIDVLKAKAEGKELVRIRDNFIPLDKWPFIIPDVDTDDAANEWKKDNPEVDFDPLTYPDKKMIDKIKELQAPLIKRMQMLPDKKYKKLEQ